MAPKTSCTAQYLLSWLRAELPCASVSLPIKWNNSNTCLLVWFWGWNRLMQSPLCLAYINAFQVLTFAHIDLIRILYYTDISHLRTYDWTWVFCIAKILDFISTTPGRWDFTLSRQGGGGFWWWTAQPTFSLHPVLGSTVEIQLFNRNHHFSRNL